MSPERYSPEELLTRDEKRLIVKMSLGGQMLRRTVGFVLAVVALLNGRMSFAAQAPAATGTIQGTAQNSTGQVLSNYTVQLRNLQTGQLAGATTSNAAGSFSFGALNPANYVIEVVNQAGAIVGTSSAVLVTAGATVTISVTTSAVAAIAASGAAAATAAAGSGATIAGVSTAVAITTAAAGAGITGVVVAATQEEASPSR
jgi:hypothetical protein